MSIWQIVVLIFTLAFQLYKAIPKKAVPKKPSANESIKEEIDSGFFNIAHYPWVFWCITYLKLTYPELLNEKLEGVTLNWILKTLAFVCTSQGLLVPSSLFYFRQTDPVKSMFLLRRDQGISSFANAKYSNISSVRWYLSKLQTRQKNIDDWFKQFDTAEFTQQQRDAGSQKAFQDIDQDDTSILIYLYSRRFIHLAIDLIRIRHHQGFKAIPDPFISWFLENWEKYR